MVILLSRLFSIVWTVIYIWFDLFLILSYMVLYTTFNFILMFRSFGYCGWWFDYPLVWCCGIENGSKIWRSYRSCYRHVFQWGWKMAFVIQYGWNSSNLGCYFSKANRWNTCWRIYYSVVSLTKYGYFGDYTCWSKWRLFMVRLQFDILSSRSNVFQKKAWHCRLLEVESYHSVVIIFPYLILWFFSTIHILSCDFHQYIRIK